MATATQQTNERTTTRAATRYAGSGMFSGFLAGVVFIALNSWFATTMGKPALAPFKTVATLVQGPPPTQASIWIGMVIHSLHLRRRLPGVVPIGAAVLRLPASHQPTI